jgi:hypothetical protein
MRTKALLPRTVHIFAVLSLGLMAFNLDAQVGMDAVRHGSQNLAVSLHVCKSGCPYSTIQAAINAASSGDTVLVDPGTYAESLTLSKGITLIASQYDTSDPRRNTAIIDGGSAAATIVIPSGVSPAPQIIGFQIRNGDDGISPRSPFTVESDYFTGSADLIDYERGGGGINRHNVYESAGDDAIDLDNTVNSLLVEGNEILNSGQDNIEIRLQDDAITQQAVVTIRNNRVEGAGQDGIQFIDYYEVTNRLFIVERNLFLSNRGAAIGMMDNEDSSEDYRAASIREPINVVNNTFVGNNYGITGGDNTAVVNNIFTGTVNLSLKNVDGSSTITYNLFDRTNYSGSNVDSNTTTVANPLLTADYGLQSGSPAIDYGIASLSWNGRSIVNLAAGSYAGAAPDLGWTESGVTSPPSVTPNPTMSGPTATRTPTTTAGPTLTPTRTSTRTPTPTGPPPTATVTPDGIEVLMVATGSDDAEEKVDTGVLDLTSSDLELVREASDQVIGLRFSSVPVPQGATILRSYVQFWVDEATSETTNLVFRAEDRDNTTTFTAASGDISSRPSTTASVAWNNVPAWNTVGEVGEAQQSPDVSTLIQAIVNRPGWSRGNALTLLITGSGKRVAGSYNGGASKAPRLYIEYSPPSQTGTFADVPLSHSYYDEIEWLYRNGYTAGCATDPLRYCPDATMNRAESSVFVERGIHSATYDPPTPSSQVFADLPLDSWAAAWVNGLWVDQYTSGCGTNPLVYCPWQGHTRAEGTVFYLRMLQGETYQPPEPTVQRFADVPLGVWYARWVEAGYLAGLIPACHSSPDLRFCPDDPLTRGLAAYMMVQAKSGPTPPATSTATPPTPSAVQWYRGNTHTHSSISDDSTSDNTATIAGWYRTAGYDFLIISDHNNDVATKQIFCHDNLSTSTFLMLCGSELSYSTHTLAFNIDQFIKGETSLQDAVTRTLNAGGVPIANHPQDSGVTATKFLGTNGLSHFEVVNGGRLGDTAAHEALWDAILSASNGRLAYGVAADDNHSCSSCVARGWIMVKAPALTKQDIEDNFRNGNFYATTGIILNDYILDRSANTITVDSQNGETITFIGNNGTILRTVQGRVATYQVVGTEKYVRVKITNAARKAAWTQPVYVADF